MLNFLECIKSFEQLQASSSSFFEDALWEFGHCGWSIVSMLIETKLQKEH